MKKFKKFTTEYKTQVILDLFKNKMSMVEVCTKYSITYPTLRKWKENALSKLPYLLGEETFADCKIKELTNENKRLIDQFVEADIERVFLKDNISKVLRIKDRKKMIEPDHPNITINRQCKLLQISRSSFYTSKVEPTKDDIMIMNSIDEIHTCFPGFGVRLINDRLRRRYNIEIGLKRTSTLMEKMNIKKPVRQNCNLYSNYLIKDLQIDHPNHVWSIDVSYIKLVDNFAYLVAIVDWFSRYVVSWQLAPTLHLHIVIEVVERAICQFGKPLFINCDNGNQFTSKAYKQLLKNQDIKISMNRKGKPTDNIAVERFFRSLKQEKLYHEELTNYDDAKQAIDFYISEYNDYRGHGRLKGKTPAQVYKNG